MQSHLSVQHFLQLAAERRAQRSGTRPAWVSELAESLSDAFEPHEGMGRIGYQAHWTDERWHVELFLGRTELCGGPSDGAAELVRFGVDLARIWKSLEAVERFEWHAAPEPRDAEPRWTYVRIEGYWREHPVTVLLHAVPPAEAGPGLRRHVDGSWQA